MLCKYCHKKEINTLRSICRCDECLDKAKLSVRKSYKINKQKVLNYQKEYYKINKDSIKIKVKEQSKNRKNRLISLGICLDCGKRDSVKGIQLCTICSEKSKISAKKYRSINKKKIQENQKRSMAKKPELYARLKHEAYLRHKDNWYRWGRERRTRKLEAGGSFTEKEWIDLLEKYGNKCLKCGDKNRLERDHVVPLIKGGDNSIENIQPLCRKCNASKSVKILDFRPFGRAILDWT